MWEEVSYNKQKVTDAPSLLKFSNLKMTASSKDFSHYIIIWSWYMKYPHTLIQSFDNGNIPTHDGKDVTAQ